MRGGESSVNDFLPLEGRPGTVSDGGGVLVGKSLEVPIRSSSAADEPNLLGIRRDHRVVKITNVLDDSIYLCDVQLEVFEADGVQLICWQDRVAFVVKRRDVDGGSSLFSADLRKFVSVKLFDIFRVGPCREGQHARGKIQAYS